MSLLEGSIWAVTSLFNPAGFRVRSENYRLFRENLRLPLLAVELGYEGGFSLGRDDAEILVQVSEGARLWQKERLLNLGFSQLPASCKYVVWMDADMIVEDPSWVNRIVEALDRTPVIQAFDRVLHVGKDSTEIERTNPSFASAAAHQDPRAILDSSLTRAASNPCCGHIWAARREVLDAVGLYDGCIIGGGDTAWVGGVYGVPDEVARIHAMGSRQSERYQAWASRASEVVGGNIGYIEAEANHLWHGSMEDRMARQRHLELSRLNFDPYQDIAPSAEGTWRWASTHPDLHSFVEDYFRSRREDVEFAAC